MGPPMSCGTHRYHASMGSHSPSPRSHVLRPRRRTMMASRNAVIVAIVVAMSGCSADSDAPTPDGTTTTSFSTTIASVSPVTTDVVAGIATDIPRGAIPAGVEASSTMAGNTTSSTSVTEFTVTGNTTRDDIAGATRSALEADGWIFRERLYNDASMQTIFDGPDAAVLTQVLTINGDTISGVVTVVRNSTP